MNVNTKTKKNKKEQDLSYTPPPNQELKLRRANMFWHYVDRLAYSIWPVAALYEMIVGSTYRKEREHFNLSKSKNILHIGCGCYPITAMILAEKNNVKIVTIDIKNKSVEYAKKVIKRKNLTDKIQAKYGNGTNYPLDGFDTIIVSGCSVPKIDVINHIIKNSKPNTRIIIRDSYLDIESILVLTNSHKKIEFVEKMENHPFPTSKWDSFYLVKK